MTSYDIWCNLKDSSKDLEFCDKVKAYLSRMEKKGYIEGFRIRRRKLGFGPPQLGEFNITVEVKDLGQLEEAFSWAATRGPDVEPFHEAVYSAVKDVTFGLSRDFPDEVRVARSGD